MKNISIEELEELDGLLRRALYLCQDWVIGPDCKYLDDPKSYEAHVTNKILGYISMAGMGTEVLKDTLEVNKKLDDALLEEL